MLDGTPTRAQAQFANSPFPFPAFVGGFGSGKTHAAVLRILRLKSMCVGQDVAYYLPTYDLISLIAKPRLIEALTELGMEHRMAAGERLMIPEWKGGIIMRNMQDPARIVGYEVAHSIVDELDTLQTEKAREAWNKIIARNRQKARPIITDAYGLPLAWDGQSVLPEGARIHAPNSVAVATTPEGFRFVYERWVKKQDPRYRLYRAKTMENPNLPAGYIDNLRATYPTQLLAAYLDGEFVNMQSGAVYFEFDRVRNSAFGMEDLKPDEALHIGMDFNVGEMAAVVYVVRGANIIAMREHVKVWDTPAMIELLKGRYPGRQIHVYPDASGSSRRSNNASESDLTLLYQARFHVHVNPSNPLVKDRVLAVNRMIHNQGARRLLVSIDHCPTFTEALEQQPYDKSGEPDKSGGLDHVLDAGGYPICYLYPIAGRTAQMVRVGGL